MLEKNFLQICDNTLSSLAQTIENNDPDSKFDVEYSDGILTISSEKISQNYVINRHLASQKIWYSSPVSGADYFVFDDKLEKWLDGKGNELTNKLLSELQKFL